MPEKKRKSTAADPPVTPSSSDSADGIRMVQVGPDHWIGLPTFDINVWFDEVGVPPEERAGILERGGGYDGFRVSADLEREAFKWCFEHGKTAVSARTPFVSEETMAELHRRFGKKPIGEKAVLEHLRRLDNRGDQQRLVEAKGDDPDTPLSPAKLADPNVCSPPWPFYTLDEEKIVDSASYAKYIRGAVHAIIEAFDRADGFRGDGRSRRHGRSTGGRRGQ